jgi:hypothetical protein
MIKNNFSLLAEATIDNNKLELVTEQANKNEPKKTYLTGPFMCADVINKNGRVYPKKVLEAAAARYEEEYIKTNCAAGELNHPPTSAINPERVVHKILELNQKDNVWYGKSVLLEGIALADLIITHLKYDMAVAVSTRGGGAVEDGEWNGKKDVEIVKDFNLVAFDVVTDPSGTFISKDGKKQRCYVDGILESKKFMIDDHGDLVEQAYNKLENGLSKLPMKSADKQMIIENALKEFLNSI